MWPTQEFIDGVYAPTLRASLFAGFLTMTGFLFTMKSFLLANLARDVFGNKDYQAWLAELRKYGSTASPTRALRQIGKVLLLTIISTLLASVSQVTLGLLASPWPVAACLGLAAIAVVMVILSIVVLTLALRQWMDFIDHQAMKVPPPNDDSP
jgi:small-conductance mechanosensitive channel